MQQHKVDEFQKTLDHFKIGNNELENVYSFCYLGAKILGDGDNRVTEKHRCDVARGRFGEYRSTLTSTKLPVPLRLRLFEILVISSLVYSSETWLFTKDLKRAVNGVSSKMLTSITKRSIHEEAKTPSYDVVETIMKRRWSYLGHILRLQDDHPVRRYLLELSPHQKPFIDGSLLADTTFENVDDMIAAAADRAKWKKSR